MKPAHHNINYIEFEVKDMEATKAFYSKAFDWSFTDYSPNYVAFKNSNGGEAGGFTLSDSVQTGGPLVVLYSNNLEDTLQNLLDAGGKISKDIFNFPGGRRFHFLDPNGHQLAVWSES